MQKTSTTFFLRFQNIGTVVVLLLLVLASSCKKDSLIKTGVQPIEDNLSVDDFIEQNFNLFPNPTSDQLNINTQMENYAIEIYTIQGQLIYDSSKNKGNIQLDYSNYSKGVYLLNIASQRRSQTFKVVKQ